MRRFKLFSIAFFIIIYALIFYLLGAFIAGDFNSGIWDSEAKGILVTIYVFIVIVTYGKLDGWFTDT